MCIHTYAAHVLLVVLASPGRRPQHSSSIATERDDAVGLVFVFLDDSALRQPVVEQHVASPAADVGDGEGVDFGEELVRERTQSALWVCVCECASM